MFSAVTGMRSASSLVTQTAPAAILEGGPPPPLAQHVGRSREEVAEVIGVPLESPEGSRLRTIGGANIQDRSSQRRGLLPRAARVVAFHGMLARPRQNDHRKPPGACERRRCHASTTCSPGSLPRQARKRGSVGQREMRAGRDRDWSADAPPRIFRDSAQMPTHAFLRAIATAVKARTIAPRLRRSAPAPEGVRFSRG